MSFNQYRGNFRKGEPENHKRAKNIIVDVLKGWGDLYEFDIHKEYPLVADMYAPYQHNYDVVAFGRVIAIEVDDPDLHNKPKKIINDKVAQARAEEKFPNTLTFIRLNKDDINYAWKENDSDYFAKNLWSKLE